jgi:ParB family chromosome partitioning protein
VNKLTPIKPGNKRLVKFDPERHRLTVAALDYGIKEAKRIKDWPALEKAIDAKIEEQQAFVAWWGGNIRSQGEARKKENRVPGFLSVSKAEDLTGMAQQRVADLKKRLKQIEKFRELLLGAEYRAACLAAADNVRGTTGTGENEWFTPPQYLDMAREVMGGIDLDPASSDRAQEVVKAAKYFTKADDGLQHEWHGAVWLNPPYAQPHIANFVAKLVAECEAGRVSSAILLTHNYTDTAWFHEAAAVANGICFTRGRIKFYEPDGAVAAPTQGQAFFYYGKSLDRFLSVFAGVGFIVFPFGPQP